MSLTPLQFETLKFIDRSIKQNGYSPSYKEIMEWRGTASKSGVYRVVSALIQRGYLKRVAHHRGLEVIRFPLDVDAIDHTLSTSYLRTVLSDPAIRDVMSDDLLSRVKTHLCGGNDPKFTKIEAIK